jgi:hypothetical protein
MVHLRRLNKLIMFADIEVSSRKEDIILDTNCSAESPSINSKEEKKNDDVFVDVDFGSESVSTIEAIFKSGEHQSYRLRLGDGVEIKGNFDRDGVFLVEQLAVTSRWADAKKGGFVPKPATSLKKAHHVKMDFVEGVLEDQAFERRKRAKSNEYSNNGQDSTTTTSTSTTYSTTTTTKEPCKFFLNSGSCQRGDSCSLLHTRDQSVLLKWKEDRHARRLLLQSGNGSRFHVDISPAVKSKRAEIFSEWLVNTFGKDRLCKRQG